VNSVVICAYTAERWEILNRAVASVARQADGDEIVLVIDHNDGLLARCREQWPELRVVPNRFGQGLSGARNTGICETSGEVIAFLDDDATAHSGWLAALVAPFADPTVGGVGGKVVPAWSEPPPPWLAPEFWWVVGCSYVGQPEQIAEIRNPIGANMALRRSVFADVGGFREEIGRGHLPTGCEETELCIRARAAGYAIWYHPAAVVDHLVGPTRTTLGYFVRRCLGEGSSKSIVSAMAGRQAGLSAERDYLRRTLPAGARRGLRQAVRGPNRLAGLQSAATICAGVAAAGAGFVRGTIAARQNRQPLSDPPRLELSGSRVA
jgi:GT2 family glycosyltransferase